MFSLICVWIKDLVNNRGAGDLIRYRAHYDVIVMNAWIPEQNDRHLADDTFSNEIRWMEMYEFRIEFHWTHYNDVVMGAMASQIISLTIVYSTVYSRCRSKKHQSSASLAFVRRIDRWPVNSPHKGQVTRKMFSLMTSSCRLNTIIATLGPISLTIFPSQFKFDGNFT